MPAARRCATTSRAGARRPPPPPHTSTTSRTARPNHGLRISLLGLPVGVAADLRVYRVWGAHLQPGTRADSAASQQFDIKVMAVMAAPVMICVLVFMAYSLIVWRDREGDDED